MNQGLLLESRAKGAFDESEAADTKGESAKKKDSFERKGMSGVYEAKREGERVR